jgi:hypothetical protein
VAAGIPDLEHAVSARAADEECDLGEIGDDRDAVRALEQAVRDSLVARVANVVEHLCGEEKASFLAGLRMRGNGCDRERNANESSE